MSLLPPRSGAVNSTRLEAQARGRNHQDCRTLLHTLGAYFAAMGPKWHSCIETFTPIPAMNLERRTYLSSASSPGGSTVQVSTTDYNTC